MTMVWVSWWRIRRSWHGHSVSAGKSAEVIVEGMILLENDHDTIDFARTYAAWLLLAADK
jgi:hypothetical protein